MVAAGQASAERLAADESLAAAVVAVTGASRHLARLVEADDGALDVLADLERRPPLRHATAAELQRWKEHEYLRIAGRDLLGLDALEATVAAISALAVDVLAAAASLHADDRHDRLAVVGMGKLGGGELNYASDIDVMFVGDGAPYRLGAAGPPGDGSGPLLLPRGRQPPPRGA